MQGIFISATGTNAGKTYISCRLIEALCTAGKRVCVRKPVISGYNAGVFHNNDSALLLAANRQAVTRSNIEIISPFRFIAAQSPDIAAEIDEKTLVFDDVVRSSLPDKESDLTLVEGAGGIMTPITQNYHTAHWIKATDLPMLLIGGCYLGGISHFLTALYTARAFGIPVHAGVINMHGFVENAVPVKKFLSSLSAHTHGLPLHVFPKNGTSDDAAALLPI